MITIDLIIEPTTITKTRSHTLQQQLLSQYLGQPETIAIDRSKKPSIINHPLQFSVSHTQHLFCLATHPFAPIGIDIECNNRKIPDRVLNRGLIPPTPSVANNHRVQYWTQFEANAKCDGTGMRFPIPNSPQNPTVSFYWQNATVSVACEQPIIQTLITIHHHHQQQTGTINWPLGKTNGLEIEQQPTIHR